MSTDSRLREASSEGQKLFKDFAVETVMREDVFKLVDTVLEKKETLDPESSYLLEKQHK